MALRLFRRSEIGGQLPGGHNHLALQNHPRADTLCNEPDHPHDGMDLGQVAAGCARLFPQIGNRVNAQHLHAQIRQMKHTARHLIEHHRIAVVQIPLVWVEGGADVFPHLLLIDKAARGGLREHVGDGLFHLPGDIRCVEADVAVNIFLFPGLGPHGPPVGIGGVVDNKVQAQAHPLAAHGGGQPAQILVCAQGGVHLVEVLHGVAAVVIRVGHLQQGHQVNICDALLLEVAQLFLHAPEAPGEQSRIHGDPQHPSRPEPLRVSLPLLVQTAQAAAPVPVGPGHFRFQPVQAGAVVVKLHVEPVQFILPPGEAAFHVIHVASISFSGLVFLVYCGMMVKREQDGPCPSPAIPHDRVKGDCTIKLCAAGRCGCWKIVGGPEL